MRGYFFGSSIIGAFVFLMLAAFVISLFGVDRTSYVVTLIFAAGVMAGGVYGIILFGALLLHIIKRAMRGRPIIDKE
jgi:polyferredoxin